MISLDILILIIAPYLIGYAIGKYDKADKIGQLQKDITNLTHENTLLNRAIGRF